MTPSTPLQTPTAERRQLALYWLALAIFSLVISGVFAFLIAVARMPVISTLFNDPGFFRRALVVHVDLGVSVWFTAFPLALFHLLNSGRRVELHGKFGFAMGAAGIILMMLTGFSRGGEPYLSNYIPVISHPMFIVGVVVYFLGVAFNYFSPGLIGSRADGEPQARVLGAALSVSQVGIRVAAVYFLISLLSLFLSSLSIPKGLPGMTHYETLMWGGGHVLQFSNVSFMVVCWILMLSSWAGREPLTRSQAFGIFAWLGLPVFIIPWIASQDVTSSAHREGFTLLMRWGLFPAVLWFLARTAPFVARGIREKGVWDARILCFLASAGLIVSGFIFGALVRGPDLRLPGHYHASIGAVTLAFMGGASVLLHEFGKSPLSDFRTRWMQSYSLLYGVGQFTFSLGMFIAGSYGMSRKSYGVEQQITHFGQTFGMWVMGAGGLIALAGGLVFVTISTRRLLGYLAAAPVLGAADFVADSGRNPL